MHFKVSANKDHQQMHNISGGHTGNYQFAPWQGKIPPKKQYNIKKNHHLKSKLAQKLNDENECHLNKPKTSLIHFFVHSFIFILVKIHCLQAHLYPKLKSNLWF